jgi:virginiamycin B lyase
MCARPSARDQAGLMHKVMKRAGIIAALVLAAAPASSAPFAPLPALASVQVPFTSLHADKRFAIAKTADWVATTPGAVWVGGGTPNSVHRIDPRRNREVASVSLPGAACAGLAVGFGSLWVPLCGKPNALARIDLKTNRLIAVYPVGPIAAEGGIAAGGDSVWMITGAKGELSRIDPRDGHVRQRVSLAPGSFNPLYLDGVVWVSGHDAGLITAVDAASSRVLGTAPTGKEPRFLTAGAGSIWTLNQGDGTITRIDARTRKVKATIDAGLPGHGGDIAFGAGLVWATLSGAPLTAIDPKTNTVVRQWVGAGGDSLHVGFGAIWLTDYDAGVVDRIPLAATGVARATSARRSRSAPVPGDR